MLKKLFNPKPTMPVVSPTNFRELWEAERVEVKRLNDVIFRMGEDRLDMLQELSVLDAKNSELGNGMFEIINQETPSANATVKRMVAIAKASLGLSAVTVNGD